MRRAIYPGSFDPLTNGHLDVIARAANLFDEVIVAVARNSEKAGTFSPEHRVELIEASVQHAGLTGTIRATHFHGLLVDFASENGAVAIVRGLRAVSDFEFEFQMALMNRKLQPALETLFLMPREDYIYLSSRLVKEIAGYGGQIADFVPPPVAEALRDLRRKSTG
ncbi:pantetheine-phosphate adenylyltransferase [soil metagenome]